LLVIAAVRRAWRRRNISFTDNRTVRFAAAASLPPLVLLSLAATARNVYLAPALPGVALLLAWWAQESVQSPDRWDMRAVRATSVLLLLGVVLFAAALVIVGAEAWSSMRSHAVFIVISAAGLILATWFGVRAWTAAGGQTQRAHWALLLAYCTLLVGPASQLYARVDAWQDLESIARAVQHDSAGRPLVLFAPDETTRAMIDMYSRTNAALIPGPLDDGAIERLKAHVSAAPQSLVLVQLRGQSEAEPSWQTTAGFRVVQRYALLPHGRRYSLLQLDRGR
jgi:4-amino-4-deoxy-L-arabinose transferase-like glycosyltransferase